MNEIQKFCLNNIYCAPSQDTQYKFRLVRVNKADAPIKSSINVYGRVKYLPDNTNNYHVFTIGNIDPTLLNLLRQAKLWFKDEWINVSEDMQARNYLLKLYNDKGVTYPLSEIFYSFIDENSLMVALRISPFVPSRFDVPSFKYLQLYTPTWFKTEEYNSQLNKVGILINNKLVLNNVDKLELQNWIFHKRSFGGEVFIYVNGVYTDTMSLLVPDYSYVEIVYDQSVIRKTRTSLLDLRTFASSKDSRNKYLLFDETPTDRILFFDDNDYFVMTNQVLGQGYYYYQHNPYSVRNVTDKDYSIDSITLDNIALNLVNKYGGSITDKVLVNYIRHSGLNRPVVYSNLKLHELYKLTKQKQLDTLVGSNNSLTELRAEYLENNVYFDIMDSEELYEITKDKAYAALGYNSISYYYGKSYLSTNVNNFIEVPKLYQLTATVYEYNSDGLLLGYYDTTGPLYVAHNTTTRYLEFIYGKVKQQFGKYLDYNSVIAKPTTEFKLYSAAHEGVTRLSNWEDITTQSVTNNTSITINQATDKKIKLCRYDELLAYDEELDIEFGCLYFPLKINEDRGTGLQYHKLDLPYVNIDLFLNSRKLTYGIDYYLNFPYVTIVNKKYIDYSKDKQSLHVRCYGHMNDRTKINETELSGFVKNGNVARNSIYDLREDKNYSVFIDGKIQNKTNILYAETDSIQKSTDPKNGLPYSVIEPFVSLYELTELETYSEFRKAKDLDNKISSFFTTIVGEKPITSTDIIPVKHRLYSPLMSKLFTDMKTNVLDRNTLIVRYTDQQLINIVSTNYSHLLLSEPYKKIKQEDRKYVTIDAVIYKTDIEKFNLDFYEYRFMENINRIYFNKEIDLSLYFNLIS